MLGVPWAFVASVMSRSFTGILGPRENTGDAWCFLMETLEVKKTLGDYSRLSGLGRGPKRNNQETGYRSPHRRKRRRPRDM